MYGNKKDKEQRRQSWRRTIKNPQQTWWRAYTERSRFTIKAEQWKPCAAGVKKDN